MLLAYVAYPTSLTLKAANSVQTYLTCRQLRQLQPETLVVVPRLLREPSAFLEIGAVHLPRIPVGKLSRLYRSTLWYYAERWLFALEVVLYLLGQRLFHRRHYQVVYVREVICAYVLARLRWLLGAKVVYEAHDLESRQPSRAKEAFIQPWLRRVDRYLLERTDALVSLTATFARYIEEKGWRPAAEVTVIPDAYDERLFHPRERAVCRGELGLPFGTQVILYAGLTFSYRGLEHLVAAFARLKDEFPRGRLYLVGGRPAEIEPLRAQAMGLGVGERVVFPGQVSLEIVPRYLGASDVLVIPGTVSDETASPLKMFEYMAMGVPMVSVDRPALREILPAEGALFVPPEDDGALEAALRWVLAHPEEAAERAAQAMAAVQQYTYRWRAERILQVVEKGRGISLTPT
jgi:glycosyltransferase involved in cell wall biosynthesis